MLNSAVRLTLLAAFGAFGAVVHAEAQSQRSSAQTVIDNARAICSFSTGASVTVTCPKSLGRDKRLAFATAIANADAVFREVEKAYDKRQGMGMLNGRLTGIDLIPRFPPDPYVMVTVLLEMPDGKLVPQIRAAEADA